MHELAPLIKDLTVILGIASIITLLFQKIRQPIVLGYLVAGMIVGPYTPPHALVDDIPHIKILSELGVIFLMFSLGLEFSFHKLRRVGFSATVTGLTIVITMLAIGTMAGKAFGWSFSNCLFLGAALSISSTTIIMKALEELRLKSTPFAELIFGVLIIEDLLAILLLAGLTTLVVTKHFSAVAIFFATLKLILVIGGWFLIGYFIVPTAIRGISLYASEESITIICVALCLSLVCVANYFHYSDALGAFIMGSILAETHLIKRIETLIRPIRDIFAAVFFVAIGMLIDPQVIWQHLELVLGITAITIFGQISTACLGAFLSGQNLNTSLRIGFSMAQIGEFSFIIISLGLSFNAINPELYPIIVAVSAITTFTTPYLIRLAEPCTDLLNKHFSIHKTVISKHYSIWPRRNPLKKQLINFSEITCWCINGLLVAIIFLTVEHLLLDHLALANDSPFWLLKSFCWLLALLLSSAFIWKMLTVFIHHKNRLMIAISGLFTILEIYFLSNNYFSNWLTTMVLMVIGIAWFSASHRRLRKVYIWLEKHFLRNLNLL